MWYMAETAGDDFEQLIMRHAAAKDNSGKSESSKSREITVGNNVILLFQNLVQGSGEIRSGIWPGERMIDGDQLITALRITYDAQTGVITHPTEVTSESEYRIFRSFLISEKTKHMIQYVYTDNQPSVEDINAAVMGQDAAPSDRWMKPDEVWPDYDWMQMMTQSVPRENFTVGDDIFFDSLEAFNRKYWSSLEDDLFRKVGAVGVGESQDSSEKHTRPKFSLKKLLKSLLGKK